MTTHIINKNATKIEIFTEIPTPKITSTVYK